jgi:hypothetical protein
VWMALGKIGIDSIDAVSFLNFYVQYAICQPTINHIPDYSSMLRPKVGSRLNSLILLALDHFPVVLQE